MSSNYRRNLRTLLPLSVIALVAAAQTFAVRERPISNVAKCVTLSGDSPAAVAVSLLGPGFAP